MLRNTRFYALVLGLIGIVMQAQADEQRVRDIPIPEEATDISYMKRRGDVRFQIGSDFKTAGNFYAKKLAEQKWTKSEKDNLQQNFWVQKFSKGKLSLEVRVDSRGESSEVRLTPKGLLWEEDDQPTPKDLPLPKDVTDLKYDDFFESIKFKSPSNLKATVEFLTQELSEKKWTKDATEFDLATFVRMKFSHGKSTLTIDVRSEDSGTEVAIRTKGMQWDGMKAEIQRAEKEAEKTAARQDKKKEMAGKPQELPPHKQKAKQGIDKLSQLPNLGTILADGNAYKLTNIVAYEVVENKRWSTIILATEKPIKQQSLIANLKRSGTDKNADGTSITWPQPYLIVTLDDDDRPKRLELNANKTPGNSAGSGLAGEALVEDGRARGTIKMTEPGSFFDKSYTAEISFDVPVLTRDSTPAKRLLDAPKLATAGTLTIGGKTYKLGNAAAYEMKQFDRPMTTVVLSERPLNLTKLKATLGTKSAEDYFEFIPQVKFVIDAEERISSVQLWADNSSISASGGEDLLGDIVIENGRARGTAKLSKPGEFFDKKYTFDISVDVEVLSDPKAAAARADAPVHGLVVDRHDGLPFPEGGAGFQSEGTKYRKQTSKTVSAELKAVVDFYRKELAAPEWTENKAAAKSDKTTATLVFSGTAGEITVHLEAVDDEVAIKLLSRDAKAAKAAGVLPASGKSRLIIGNGAEKDAVVSVNKKDYNLAAGAGVQDPKAGLNWEVLPGKYTVEAKVAGDSGATETLSLGADEAWGVIVLPSGECVSIQLY